MKLILCVFIAASLSLFGTQPQVTESLDKNQAMIQGRLTDSKEGVIGNVELVFTGPGGTHHAHTERDGTYSIALKQGIYTVQIASPPFCSLHRGDFLVKAGATIRIDFQLWICGSDALYNFRELDYVPKTHLRPLVLFGRDHNKGDVTVFTGAVLDRMYPVVFTFNLLSVRATELEYDPIHHLAVAKGNVEWQNGTTSGSGQRLQIKLESLEPDVSP